MHVRDVRVGHTCTHTTQLDVGHYIKTVTTTDRQVKMPLGVSGVYSVCQVSTLCV